MGKKEKHLFETMVKLSDTECPAWYLSGIPALQQNALVGASLAVVNARMGHFVP